MADTGCAATAMHEGTGDDTGEWMQSPKRRTATELTPTGALGQGTLQGLLELYDWQHLLGQARGQSQQVGAGTLGPSTGTAWTPWYQAE